MLEEKLKQKFLRCRRVLNPVQVDESLLEEDLNRYIHLAKELFVNDAVVVHKADLLLDLRVTLKCRVPFCRYYGTCSNCPPYTGNFDENQEVIKKYKTGILLRWEFPRKEVLDPSSDIRRSIFKAISIIESAAFYDGYYLACGFATGSCRQGLCDKIECQLLNQPEKGCRHPLLARPSMEAMGFDVFGMAAKAGWKIFPAGKGCPEQIHSLSRIGLVLIT